VGVWEFGDCFFHTCRKVEEERERMRREREMRIWKLIFGLTLLKLVLNNQRGVKWRGFSTRSVPPFLLVRKATEKEG